MKKKEPHEKPASNKSLAKQINNYWLNASLGNFIALDIIIFFTAVIVRCIAEEARYGVKGLLLPRYFDISRETGVIYHFGEYSADLDTFFVVLICCLAAVCISQLIMLAAGAYRGGKEARRILKPINEIAVSAVDIASSQLSNSVPAETAPKDEHKDVDLSDLQTAINKLDPTAESHIHTGNSDLEGLEEAVNSLLERMRESYLQQAQFVSDASHELRTPIAVIKGYAGMLDRWGKTDEKVLDESIAAIKNESEHIGKLVEQLLFLARGDNGRQTVNMDVFSLSDMMKDVYSEYCLIDDKHEYICDINGEFMAYGDVSMIKQTVRILTDNAKKYTPEGGEIVLRVKRNVKGEVCVEVQDNGIGMNQTDIEHIFERFYRADPARSRDTGGCGLGLSIAKWIVDRHGGRFEVSSVVGIGTRMTVVLPKLSPDSADFILNDEKPATSRFRG
ncbi:MAG: sensor histidine kinase [Oscillospiraceae bacterium]